MLSRMRWPDENHLFYRRTKDDRQNHPSSRADIRGRTSTSASCSPAGAPDGSRGEWGVFLKAFQIAFFCLFEGRVYLEPDDLEASGELCCFLCFDPAVLDVIILSQDAKEWELRKIVKNLLQAKKRNSYQSTNYDLLFEYIAWKKNLRCSYPVKKENLEKLRILKYDIPYISIGENEMAPIMYKLHGSINFFEDKKKLYISGDAVPPNNNLKIGKSLIKDMPEIFAFDALYCLMQKGDPSAPSIIPPTYAKLEGKPWLHEMWNGALKSLQGANQIIFIGYSIPQTDGFIHALIQSAMALREYNPPPRVFVIDPAPSKEYQRLFRGKVKSYKSCFGQAIRNGLVEKIFKACCKPNP